MAEASEKKIKSMIFQTIARIVVYGLLMMLLSQLMFWDAGQQGQQIKFLEDTFTEWTQQLILLTMAGIFAHNAYHHKEFRSLSILLAGISLTGLVREFNNFFNDQVFDGAWQTLASLVIITTIFLVWKHRNKFWLDFQQFQNTLSFGFLLSGFLTTFIFSRLFGRTRFWETLMEDRYFRSVKNAAEEGVELLGYGLLLAASVEFLILVRSARDSEPYGTDDHTS